MHPKLEKAMPLLEHLYAGGALISGNSMFAVKADHVTKPTRYTVTINHVIEHPDDYTIHREPRVVFIAEGDHGTNALYSDSDGARRFVEVNKSFKLARYVEDLNWKPS
jgi:hypothetical protein